MVLSSNWVLDCTCPNIFIHSSMKKKEIKLGMVMILEQYSVQEWKYWYQVFWHPLLLLTNE